MSPLPSRPAPAEPLARADARRPTTPAGSGLRARLATTFVSHGWLLPAFFPLALLGGRGAFNSLFFLYLLWAALAAPLWRHAWRTQGAERGLPLVLGGLFLAYLPSACLALEPLRALEIWLRTLLYASVAPITLAVLAQAPGKLQDLLRALGIGAGAALLGCYADLAKTEWLHDAYVARLELRAVDLPFCLPFLLGWLALSRPPAWRRAAIVAALAAVASFVVISDERGSLVGLLAALAGLGLLVMRAHPGRVVAAIAIVVAVAMALNGPALLRGLTTEGALFTQLDAFSSWRLSLWLQALQNPPDNLWLGVGMGNVEHYATVVTLNDHPVRHLHNLWLDAWYETGLLGLAALLATLTYAFAQAARAWRRLADAERVRAGLFLTAAIAVIAQTQFSISYASREFNIYVFLCLAAVLHLGRQAKPAPTPVANTAA
ncbi:MAG: O-antigen ligase family protein [Rhodocyclaceae bacterium]